MKPRSKIPKMVKLSMAVALCLTGLQGCATSYQSVKREAQAVREALAITSEVPITRRATCVRQQLTNQGLDPSRLRFFSSSRNVTMSENFIGPNAPQIDLDLEVQRVLSEMGFTVFAGLSKLDPEAVTHTMVVNITSYTPLSSSISGVDELDLTLLGISREMLVAQGTVRVTAVLSSREGNDYTVWKTSQSVARFYQIKGRRGLNGALTTGVATGGTARERIEVSSVQDATILVSHEAAVEAVAKALSITKC